MEFWSKFFDSIAFFQKAIFIFGQNLFHDSQLYQQMAFPEKRMTISDITEERPEFIEGRPADIIFFGVRKEVVAWQRNERRRNKLQRLCKVCPP